MRNVVLALSIVLMPFLAGAQTFLTQSGTSDSTTGLFTGGTDLQIVNGLKSASSNTVTLNWHVSGFVLGTGWKVTGFCDNNTCYYNDPVTKPPYGEILNGKVYTSFPYGNTFGDFHVIFDPTAAANLTSSWVQAFVFDPTGNYGRTLTFVGKKNANGVLSVSVSSDDVVVYPNPAKDAVNVIYDAKSNVKTIAVYNLIGKLMGPVYVPSSNTSAKIDLNDVPNGVYFIRLMNNQGNVVATRRFTRQ